jgi:hypothetical protein
VTDDAVRRLEKSLARDNPAFAALLRERDANPQHAALIEGITEGIAPVIRDYVARQTAPLEARIAELEAKQKGVVRAHRGGVKCI